MQHHGVTFDLSTTRIWVIMQDFKCVTVTQDINLSASFHSNIAIKDVEMHSKINSTDGSY